jgi:hypothetical protein
MTLAPSGHELTFAGRERQMKHRSQLRLSNPSLLISLRIRIGKAEAHVTGQ